MNLTMRRWRPGDEGRLLVTGFGMPAHLRDLPGHVHAIRSRSPSPGLCRLKRDRHDLSVVNSPIPRSHHTTGAPSSESRSFENGDPRHDTRWRRSVVASQSVPL